MKKEKELPENWMADCTRMFYEILTRPDEPAGDGIAREETEEDQGG
jgi:hypothetical protein